jgi:hypothetical protein
MSLPAPHRPTERRTGNDAWLVAIRVLAGLGWLALACALFYLDQAKPQVETFFDRWYHIHLRQAWRLDVARYILYSMLGGLAFSCAGLAVNLRRNRRRDDHLRLSLLFIGLVSLAGIIKYLLSF